MVLNNDKLEELFLRALNICVSDIDQINLVVHFYNLLKEKELAELIKTEI